MWRRALRDSGQEPASHGQLHPDGKDWEKQVLSPEDVASWPKGCWVARGTHVPGFSAPEAPTMPSPPAGRPPSHLFSEFGPHVHIKTQLWPHLPTPPSPQGGGPLLP